jgi:hypothetical protein
MGSMRLDGDPNVSKKIPWLRQQREMHDSVFQEINDLCTPYRGDLYGGQNKGRRKPLYDPTAALAADRLVNFFIASLFSSSFDWLALREHGAISEDRDRQQALDDTALRILDALAASNFYVSAQGWVTDWTVIGNGTNYVQHDEEGVTADRAFGGLMFDPIPWTRIWWVFSHIGRPLCILVEREMPAEEAYHFAVSIGGVPGEYLKSARDSAPYEPVEIYHLVSRNNYGKKRSKQKPWSSAWYAGGSYEKIKDDGGYDENPYIAARQMILDGEQYGRGRGHIARPYAKGVNVLTYQELLSLGKELNPPFISEDGALVAYDFTPNGQITINPPREFEPRFLRSGTDFATVESIRQYFHRQINEAFLGDVLAEPDTQTRSAAAEQSRLNRAITRVSSVNNTVMHEMLEPMIATVIDIMLQRGALPELAALGPMQVKPVFTSPFFSAQKATSANRVYAFVERRLQMWERTSDPRWLEDLDDDAIRAYEIDMTDVPSRIFRSEEKLEEVRQARAAKEAQNRMLEVIQGRAGRANTQVQLRPGGTPPAGEGLANPPGVAV